MPKPITLTYYAMAESHKCLFSTHMYPIQGIDGGGKGAIAADGDSFCYTLISKTSLTGWFCVWTGAMCITSRA